MKKLFKCTMNTEDALSVLSEWQRQYGERLIHFNFDLMFDGRSAIWGKALTVKEMKEVRQ